MSCGFVLFRPIFLETIILILQFAHSKKQLANFYNISTNLINRGLALQQSSANFLCSRYT